MIIRLLTCVYALIIVVNWGFVVWVQGARRENFGDARFLLRLVIWAVWG